jgi:hypothetical protein
MPGGSGLGAKNLLSGGGDFSTESERFFANESEGGLSVKVNGDGMGGGGDDARKALYGAEDGEERFRDAPSVKVAGDGMGGGGDDARKAHKCAEDVEDRIRDAHSV